MENFNNTNNSINEIVHLRKQILRYVNRWYWFALTLIAALVLAYLYIQKTPQKYEVRTVILLRNDDNSPNLSQTIILENLGFGGLSKATHDEIQVISSRRLIEQTIDSLGLQTDFFEKKGLKYIEKFKDEPFKLAVTQELLDSIKYKIQFTIKEDDGKYVVNVFAKKRFKSEHILNNIQEPFKTPVGTFNFVATSLPKVDGVYRINLYSKKQIVSTYGSKLKVETVNKDSEAIKLSVVESNVKKAEDFLNTLVSLYKLDAIEDKNIIVTNTANFIKERLDIITGELFDVEAEVENYKRSNSLTDLSSEATLYLETASEYDKKLTGLETQLNMINAVEQHINNTKNQNALIPANVVTEDASLARSIQEYNLAVLERMKLSQTANEKNPALVMADQQIAALRSNVMASVSSVKSGLMIARNDALRRNAQFTSKIKGVPTQERQFIEIKRQQEIKQELYLFLSKKREEIAINLASAAPAARTIDRAFTTSEPVAPKKNFILLAALMLGVLIPFLVIYLKDLLNNKIEDASEFQQTIKAPYLGSIGVSRRKRNVVVIEGNTSPVVEMFRALRTNLTFILGSNNKSHVVLVTSSYSGEGKSFISLNLAMSFALLKKKVLLMGMDIRNPMLGEYLELTETTHGITSYLADESTNIEEFIIPSGHHKNLDVILGGIIPPNPAELLVSARLDDAIAQLKNKYDMIIIDTSPVGRVADTYLLDRISDATVFVVRQNYTLQSASQFINEIYDEKRLKGLSVVLNGTSAVNSGYGYGYEYEYAYKKGKIKYKAPKLSFDERLKDFYRSIGKKKKPK
jgi:capsular exopolysaccharide synthesis family protein